MLDQLTAQLSMRQPLSAGQVAGAVRELIDANGAPAVKAAFLTALAQKGETPDEITSFALELRALSIAPPLDDETRAREILDVCGTGGDHLGTFNISTTVALVCAAGGVAVAKHGNRAVTSQSGSADVLEALGVCVDVSPAEAASSLAQHNFAFFFAPNYHPAFKHIAPARKLCAGQGQRTIFNLLGPLLNPARPTAQLMGVPRPELCAPIARVLQSLGIRRAMVACGKVRGAFNSEANDAWLDELSTLGENTVAEFYQERGFSTSSLSPDGFQVQTATLRDLLGGDRAANAEITRRILHGIERGPKREVVLFNAGAAFFVAGRVRSISEGWNYAAEVIDSGQARDKLKELTQR